METLFEHFNQWWGVVFFTIIYSIALFFVPFYKKMDRKPATAYMAFVLAFAIEMHGIPFSMYLIALVLGRYLPEGILWGHTLSGWIGYTGMYINGICAVTAMLLIGFGWRSIYRQYWSADKDRAQLVKTGVYRYIRHPQYTGFMLLTLGMIVEWATLPLLILWPFLFLLYYRLARREEQDMLLEFGEEYVMYRQRTKMFIPFMV
jgi:protein-S-isoprenylcysteine O-methyltransferase Ste14